MHYQSSLFWASQKLCRSFLLLSWTSFIGIFVFWGYVHVYVPAWVYVCGVHAGTLRSHKRALNPWDLESCELPDMAAWNWTQLLCKSRRAPNCWAVSPASKGGFSTVVLLGKLNLCNSQSRFSFGGKELAIFLTKNIMCYLCKIQTIRNKYWWYYHLEYFEMFLKYIEYLLKFWYFK